MNGKKPASPVPIAMPLSRRDRFAQSALQGLLANAGIEPEKPRSYVILAYAYADEMIEHADNGKTLTAEPDDE